MQLEVRHIKTLEERLAVFPLYHQLNPRLSEAEFHSRMTAMMDEKNYHLLGIFDGSACMAISGYWVATKLYCGKYLEPDNVVVDRNARSQGIGEMLQTALENIARTNGCAVMMLDAYLENHRGHQFYERHGYSRKGYHFVKKLTA